MRVAYILLAYNEESFIQQAVRDLLNTAKGYNDDFAIYVCENGSKDKTVEKIDEVIQEINDARIVRKSFPEPSYAKTFIGAVRGIDESVMALVEVDHINTKFLHDACLYMELHPECGIVIGSKTMKGSNDRRPFSRRMITRIFNLWLRLIMGSPYSDTHGIKIFRKEKLEPIISQCKTDLSHGADLFPTELLIRMARQGIPFYEIPIEIEELRDARINIFYKARKQIKSFYQIWKVLRN